MRKEPVESVMTVCSPWSAGDVAVTTTSARGRLLEASTTCPVNAPLPICAAAERARSKTANAKSIAAQRSADPGCARAASALCPRVELRRFLTARFSKGGIDQSYPRWGPYLSESVWSISVTSHPRRKQKKNVRLVLLALDNINARPCRHFSCESAERRTIDRIEHRLCSRMTTSSS